MAPGLPSWDQALLLEANAASPVQRAVRELKTRLEARLGDALNTALDAVLGPGGGRSGVGGGLQNGGGMVRSASEAAQARSGGAAGLAGVLSLLGSGDQDAAGAAQWQQQEQQVRNIAMIDLSQGESEATAGAGGSSSGAARPPQAVRVLREPTPEPKLVAAVAGADLPGTALPAASSEPARQQRGAAEQAVAVAAAAAQSAAQEDDTSVVEPESVSQLVPGVEAAGLEGFFEQMTPEPLLQRQQQQQQQKEDSNAGRSPELLHYGGGDPDAPAVATALAQQQASSRLVAGSEAVSASEPEVLLPPGRLIWLFREAPPQEARVATDGGEVDVAAAMEAVEQRGGAGAGSAAADQQGREEGVALACSYGATVAAIAERHTFSRILLSPSMMEDHVPDAYLRALSAL